jgi:hypothetical protein
MYVYAALYYFFEIIQLLTPWSTHKRTPHHAVWLYQAVVAGGEATLAIGKGGKNFTYFLRLRTQ